MLGSATANEYAVWANTVTQSVLDSFAKTKKQPDYKNKTELHHIVAKKSLNAHLARTALKGVGYSVDDDVNLIRLKTGLHKRLHTNLYYEFANALVYQSYYAASGNPAQQKANVDATLGVLKVFLTGLNAMAPY